MIILPAIDLMSRQVVRLRQGKAEDKTVYSNDPAAFALKWQQEGGEYLHIVDLDGAFAGTPQHTDTLKQIRAAITIPFEVGGGVRTQADVEALLSAGANRVIIGSKACESPEWVAEMIEKFGSEKIVLGIDAKDGFVATKGWTEGSKWEAVPFAQKMATLGVRIIIYTDISTDGMLQGPNLPAMREMVEATGVRIIASGGVSSAADIDALNKIPNLYGAIVGKALYDGKVTLPQCLSITQ